LEVKMNTDTSEQSEVDALDKEYREYVERLRIPWLFENRVRSKNVYEVMDEEERKEVHERMAAWSRYITPLAEAWWKKRGYGIIWPDDDSKPVQLYKLGTNTPRIAT
jgi:hypothetical protein